MNGEHDEQLKRLIRQAIAPVKDAELQRDLWPQMLKKLQQHEPVRVPWFDWVLAAISCLILVLFPSVIPALLYHL
jgi:type VI protein secretion system component VasF